MAVYLDALRPTPQIDRPGMDRSCHMMADYDSELEAMAEKIGLREAWRHGDHYDVGANKRRQAISLGGQEVTTVDLVKLRQRKRSERIPT